MHNSFLTHEIKQSFAPTGILRASINVGNPILAKRGGDNVGGVSVDLAHAFGDALGVEVEFKVFESARESVQAVSNNNADIGFFAIDPLRANEIAFTPPYVLIEGSYLVAENSALTSNHEVDAPGMRLVVGAGSAYDLFLSREIKHAEIIRSATSPTVVDTYVAISADVAAGVKQQLEADSQRLGGLRLLPGNFMVIRQAMGCSKSLPDAAIRFLRDFIEEKKSSGYVGESLIRNRINGATVAPPDGQ